jgi:hypothetical protein
MKIRLLLFVCFILVTSASYSQSKTTGALEKKFPDSRALFAYKNTLRMWNIKEDPELDALVDNIEKMKLLMIKKPKNFTSAEYKKIIGDYKIEKFEEAMTTRYEGKSFDVFLKGKDKDIDGMLVLINDTEMLYVLDIVGYIALDKVSGLYKMAAQSEDFSEMLNQFQDKPKKDDNDK